MQSTTYEIEGSVCRKCGSGKFVLWNGLDSKERIAAERFLEAEYLSGTARTNFRYCARCLNPQRIPETRA